MPKIFMQLAFIEGTRLRYLHPFVIADSHADGPLEAHPSIPGHGIQVRRQGYLHS